MGRVSQPLEAEQLYEYAIGALARRSLTERELRRRLERRAAASGDVEQVLLRLRSAGYLDDARVAEAYSVSRREHEGYGRSRVLRDLRRRGVAKGTARQAVEATFEDADELAMARAYLRRKLGVQPDGPAAGDRKRLTALFRALLRAGFSSDKIGIVLREISSDSDWIDTLAEQHRESGEEEDSA